MSIHALLFAYLKHDRRQCGSEPSVVLEAERTPEVARQMKPIVSRLVAAAKTNLIIGVGCREGLHRSQVCCRFVTFLSCVLFLKFSKVGVSCRFCGPLLHGTLAAMQELSFGLRLGRVCQTLEILVSTVASLVLTGLRGDHGG